MKSHMKFLLATFTFASAIFIVNFARHRIVLQKDHNAKQQRFLNARFVSVSSRNAQVTMRARPHFLPSFDIDKPRTIALRETFTFVSHHWRGEYFVSAIESDGLLVNYRYYGWSPSPVGNWSGVAKIYWK